MIPFALGLILGGLIGWILYTMTRRDYLRVDVEKQRLAQEKQIVLDFMHNMVEAIGAGVTRDELYQRILHTAILSTGALSACIFEKTDENKLRGLAVEGLFPPQRPLPANAQRKISTRAKFIEQVLRSEEFELGEGLIGAVAVSGKGEFIPDARTDSRVIVHDDPSLIIRSLILAPILYEEENIGVLVVANRADERSFSETDYSLALSLAEQSGLAIHNADLMNLQLEKNKLDMDISLASSIQSMLLPKTFPQQTEFDLDARYLPAQKVGGDFYDIFPLSESRIGVAIADASGKGIPASLLMAICQSKLRYLARQFDSPSRVLIEMNRDVAEETREDMFVTLIYAIVDSSTDEIVIARAGHELPMHGHCDTKDGLYKTTMIGSEGIALGMVEPELFESVIEDKTIPFVRDDVLLLYTDGITESANWDGTEFSSSRLTDLLKSLHDLPAIELNQGILDSVSRFTGSAGQRDDITLVTVKHR